MKKTKTALQEVPYFSSTFLAYIQQDPQLKPYYGHYPSIASARHQIEEKKFPATSRQILADVLDRQYQGLKVSDKVAGNIQALRSKNCYTVVTGHQLNLFTGPLYVILKMITTINACKELKKAYPDKEFVPVYWMATEDHDFQEINHFHFNGSRIEWKTNQTGAVGHFSTRDMAPLLKELSALPAEFLRAYQQQKTLAGAVRSYMNDLFGGDGLVVLDADDRQLKSLFSEVMRDDILHGSLQKLVAKTSQDLDEKGFKTQIFARRINFFYLDDQQRSRIEKQGETYTLADNQRSFTQAEMEQLINDSPERLSPNVILRPLYEEMILPNIAYCGGPSELIYWMQLKPLFEKYQVAFPMLLPRNFAMIIPEHLEKKWDKTHCTIDDLFLGKEPLLKKLTLRESDHQVELNGQKKAIEDVFTQIKKQAHDIDPTMSQHVEAQWAKTEKRLDLMEKKFIRAEKRHHTDLLRQCEDVLDSLFPNGGLQERHDNILNFYQTDPEILNSMKDLLDPFDYSFNILRYGK